MSKVDGAYVALDQTSCWCGIPYCVPSTLLASIKATKGTIYCPLGHSGSYGESEAQRLKKQVEALEERNRNLAKREEWAREEAKKAAQQEAAAKTKLRNATARAKAGVCPCCKRTVAAMARHMTTKHPEYTRVG